MFLGGAVDSGPMHSQRGSNGQPAPASAPLLCNTIASDAPTPGETKPPFFALQQSGAIDPLYVMTRGLEWQRERNIDAGWELLRLLRSSDSEIRMLAANLLAKSERLRARDVRRARRKLTRSQVNYENGALFGPSQKVKSMNTPYGLEMVDSCVSCKLRKNQWFCGLSPESLRLLGRVSHLITYPSGALLFVEGQSPRGAFVLCSGKVKLSTTSREGKVLILRIAEAGEALGLSAVISAQPFELTAETTGPCQVNFIDRGALIERIEQSGELGLRSSQVLSREFQSAYRDIHSLVLARSSAGKLARLLLSWTSRRETSVADVELRIHPAMTHEEMAQMIGASRETVTRLIGDLKKRDFIRLEGSTLVIRNRVALEALAA